MPALSDASTPCVPVAIAQSTSEPGDVVANVARHVSTVRRAAAAGARVVVFPELSLTGYELARIEVDPDLTLSPGDARLEPLRAVAVEAGVTVLVGAPWRDGGSRTLGAVVVSADGTVRAYAKRNLHGEESRVFTAGTEPMVLEVDGLRLLVGVCADLADGAQVGELGSLDADAWLLGVLLSPRGYDTDAARAARAARGSGASVLLANHAAPTGGWEAAGGSGMWTPHDSTCLARATSEPDGDLLVVAVGRKPR